MKQCLKCQQTYTDETLNFCLNDGEMLVSVPGVSQSYADPPPTVIMNDPRSTNPSSWQPPTAGPVGQWQGGGNMQNSSFGVPSYMASRDKTLPTIAMIVGICSLIMICCYGGFWLGIPAAVIGFFGMRNATNDPTRYDGRGMAIAGIAMGTVSFLTAIGIIFLALLGNLK